MASFLSLLSTLNRENFTKKENEIIDYIRANMKEVTTMNIEDLALRVQTGYSAIYGLLKKLKIKGYRDFLISLASDIEIKSLDSSNTESITKKNYFDVINQNHALLDEELIERTLSTIKSSYRIFVLGIGTANALSQTLALELFRFGFNAYEMEQNEEDAKMRARFLNENDLVIAYSLYGNNASINDTLAIAKKNKATIISISGKGMSSVVELSNWSHIVFVPKIENNVTESYVNKMLPWMFFTDKILNRLWKSDEIDRDYIMEKSKISGDL